MQEARTHTSKQLVAATIMEHRSGNAAAGFSASQLRYRYIVALSLIATLTILSQVVVQWSISDQSYDSRVVNIAGRQRMLSQKITKTGYALQQAADAKERNQLRQQLQDALNLWQSSHIGLQHGDDELQLPGDNSNQIVELFRVIEDDYQAMVLAAQKLLAKDADGASIAAAVKQLAAHEASFLHGMDVIVFRYDAEAKARVKFASYLELGLAAFTILVLLLEAWLIFAPAVRRLRYDMFQRERHQADVERLFSASPTAMFLISESDLTISRSNSRAVDLMGCAEKEIIGRSFSDFLDDKYPSNHSFLDKMRAGASLNEYEVLLIDACQSTIEALASSCQILYSDRPSYVIGVTDISKIKQAQQTLEYYATFDEMTSLVNRRTGLLMLASEMGRSKRSQCELTVCFVDLDGLKLINDTYGHQQGDLAIQGMAKVLQESVRSGDVAMRLGGDEFVLVLHNCSETEAGHLVERIEQGLVNLKDEAGPQLDISASFGLAVYDPSRHDTAEELLAEADATMYKAKKNKQSEKLLADLVGDLSSADG